MVTKKNTTEREFLITIETPDIDMIHEYQKALIDVLDAAAHADGTPPEPFSVHLVLELLKEFLFQPKDIEWIGWAEKQKRIGWGQWAKQTKNGKAKEPELNLSEGDSN